ncbi:MAG: hypothetical protein C4583_16220 [Anaerolineaceae bacterium]|nr:MAG: hypothetical protein C4583_16220 [Anaerolineaceae bacterium]
MNLSLRRLLTPTVIFSSTGLACLLSVIALAWFGFRASPPPSNPGLAPAYLTLIPASTSTPLATPAPTLDPLASTPTLPADVIVIGGYVQINGTGGDGLRLRSAPGLTSEQLFLGEDAEVFQVRDGPQEANGYIWWYIVAPYDESRAGWAAANFLAVVPPPQ